MHAVVVVAIVLPFEVGGFVGREGARVEIRGVLIVLSDGDIEKASSSAPPQSWLLHPALQC